MAKKRWHVRRIAKASAEDILVQLTVCNRGSRGQRSRCCRRSGCAMYGHERKMLLVRSFRKGVRSCPLTGIAHFDPSGDDASPRGMKALLGELTMGWLKYHNTPDVSLPQPRSVVFACHTFEECLKTKHSLRRMHSRLRQPRRRDPR